MYGKDTETLFSELRHNEDIEKFLSHNQDEFLISQSEFLNRLLRSKNLFKAEVIKESRIERTYGYHIFAGTKKPSRTKLLAIARAMKLNLTETQYLLRYMNQALLYPRNPWDAIIISAIERDLSVEDTNILLERMGESQMLN